MKRKKSVLVADSDKTIRTALSIILQEMGLKVFEAGDGLDAIKTVRSKKIDLLITNLLLPKLNGIELIKNVQKVRRQAESIALSTIVNGAVYDHMRMLDVFRIFQIPFKINEVNDAMLRALSSTRIERLMNEENLYNSGIMEQPRILVESPDIAIFQRLLEIGLMEGFGVDYTKEVEDFSRLLTIGLYDVIVITEPFFKMLNPNDMQDIIERSYNKPSIVVLSDSEKNPGNMQLPLPSKIYCLPLHFKKEEFLQLLRTVLPQYTNTKKKKSMKRKIKKRHTNIFISFFDYIKYQVKVISKPVLYIYLILIVLAGIIGFFASSLLDGGGKSDLLSTSDRESEMINELLKYQNQMRK